LGQDELKVLFRVLRFSVHFAEAPNSLDRLIQEEQQVRAKAAARFDVWLREVGPLAQQARRIQRCFAALEWTVKVVSGLFLSPLEEEHARKDSARPLTFSMGRRLRGLIREEGAFAALDELKAAAAHAQREHERLVADWEEHLARWRRLPPLYRNALRPCEVAARGELGHVREAQRMWLLDLDEKVESLRAGLTQVRQGLLSLWDRASKPGLLGRLLGGPRLASFTVDPRAVALPAAQQLQEDVVALRTRRLGPSVSIRTGLFLEWLQFLREQGANGAR
jgi:hypothetical protein